ncbi:MAG: hypothetical protein M1835_003314 [Candelina submexicana]|nr:MAG: hypothetical protein M1835_003314 [Candelina submexicana]
MDDTRPQLSRDDSNMAQIAPSRQETGKQKRQLLSCITCRQRKVKCDRVKPCRACCARSRPKECVFTIGEGDHEPIMQSYELDKLRKANLALKEALRASRQAQSGNTGDDEQPSEEPSHRPRVPSKPLNLKQKRLKGDQATDNLYFGSPGLANVVEDVSVHIPMFHPPECSTDSPKFANLQLGPQSSSVSHAVPRGVDIFAFQDAPSYAFPTLWPASGGAVSLLKCLPPKDELLAYMDAFQKRAQSCSFPHVPEEITAREIERFLADPEGNAFKYPDMLALIFAALAQGLQNGVYDRCGQQWLAGAMEAEALKGDVYIAAAMQALRFASFMNRPSLLGIQTLIMIGPYLTNAGKFLDAWALFGTTIRLAQSIGLHRNPKVLDPAPPPEECALRQSLWWWMLHMDQQYSATLGRPLGISGIGDCPPLEPLTTNPTVLRVAEYINQFTILARQILSSDRLSNIKIDEFTDKLLALRDTLPECVQFDEQWLQAQKDIPDWPLDAIAAGKRDSSDSAVEVSQDDSAPARGRKRVLMSCRALLTAFEFFSTRVRAAMICWTMGQQAFNAAMILTLAMMEDDDDRDMGLVHRTYNTFSEMNQKGIHKLAGMAVEKLGSLIKGFEESAETVMGNTGMILLEDPGLQGFIGEGFAPLGFQMAGRDLPSSHETYGGSSPGWAARPMRSEFRAAGGGSSKRRRMAFEDPAMGDEGATAAAAAAGGRPGSSRPAVPAKKPGLGAAAANATPSVCMS